MRPGNKPRVKLKLKVKVQKRGTLVTFIPVLFSFPFTRGIGVKNLDGVSLLNGATASGR